MRPWLERLAYPLYRVLPDPLTHRAVRWATPNYTLGVVPFVTRDDGRVLLVRQSYRPFAWGAPGGLCERREHPADTTIREVREEAGLEVVLVGRPAIVVHPRMQKVQFVSRCEVSRSTAADSAAPRSTEILEVGWFHPDAFPLLLDDVADSYAALVAAESLERSDLTAGDGDHGARGGGSPTIDGPGA